MVPELDHKYSFSVKLEKNPKNLIDDSTVSDIFIESNDSKAFEYTPYAAWKNAPNITYASQTADGEVTLKWEHDDNGLGCAYKVIKNDMLLVVKKGEEEIGKTADKEYVIKDLMNGKYNYVVVPTLLGEDGYASTPSTIEVKNSWVAAPSFTCDVGEKNQIVLNWNASEGIERYHITVSVGDGSILRFVNLDFKEYAEFDVEATPGDMTYKYTYDQNSDSEGDTKLKFEIYGIRHAANGDEQKSATTSQTITLTK